MVLGERFARWASTEIFPTQHQSLSAGQSSADTISYKILRLVLLFYARNQFEKAILNISNAYRAWGAKMLKRMMDLKNQQQIRQDEERI